MGQAVLDLDIHSGGNKVDNFGFFNAFGYSALEPQDLSFEVPGFSKENIQIASFDFTSSIGKELIDGIDFSVTAPSGDDKDHNLKPTGTQGALIPISGNVEQNILSIKTNPIETFGNIPYLKQLDFLTEDLKKTFSFGGTDYELALEYTIWHRFLNLVMALSKVSNLCLQK